jgi:hypothetical protein
VGRKTEALDILEELEEESRRQYIPASHIAMVYLGLNEKDKAITWLEKSFEQRYPLLIDIAVEPRMDRLRSHPRFQDLLRRMNLPEGARPLDA